VNKSQSMEATVIDMLEDGEDFDQIAKYILGIFPEYHYNDAIDIIMRLEQGYIDTNDFDDSMDGDDASALASAGYGTDEDYGYYSEEY